MFIDCKQKFITLFEEKIFIPISLKKIASGDGHTPEKLNIGEYHVNIDQNKIIKMFTVISVIFMPPTLIASIYGMNFTDMPEINWPYGYEFSLALMVLAVVGILIYFKKKKWL